MTSEFKPKLTLTLTLTLTLEKESKMGGDRLFGMRRCRRMRIGIGAGVRKEEGNWIIFCKIIMLFVPGEHRAPI